MKTVYTIGSAAEKIERQLAGVVKMVAAGTLEVAVGKAAEAAAAGEVVLLAPACSSFDQFENYEHRGRVFKDLVKQLECWLMKPIEPQRSSFGQHDGVEAGCGMAKRVGVDKWLFGTVLLLVLFGLVMVFSASAVMAKETMGSPYAFVVKQALWALLGMVALTVLMRVDYRRYNSHRFVVGAVAVTTLLLLGVFAMHGMNGAHRWIRVGGIDVAAFGAGEAGDCAVSGVLSADAHACDGGLEDGAEGGAAGAAVCGADLEGAGPGHGAGVRGCDGADAVPGGRAVQVLPDGRGGGGAGDVLHAVPCGVPARADAGVPESAA